MYASITELANRAIADHFSMFAAIRCLLPKSSCASTYWSFTSCKIHCLLTNPNSLVHPCLLVNLCPLLFPCSLVHGYPCSFAYHCFVLVVLLFDYFSWEWDIKWRALETKSLTSQWSQLLQTTFLKLQLKSLWQQIK